MDLLTDTPVRVTRVGYRVPNCPYQSIVDLYHEVLPMLPGVVILNTSRRGYISGRWREVCAAEKWGETEGLAFFKTYFEMVAKSRFLTGRCEARGDRRVFKADLEWLMRPNNFAKALEGRYS